MKTIILTILLLILGSSISSARDYRNYQMRGYEEDSILELPKVKGVVRLIDLANSKIKLKHERIPNLDMPPMTMTFSVAEPQMLDGLANGDRVLFTADMVNNKLTVMWIEKQ